MTPPLSNDGDNIIISCLNEEYKSKIIIFNIYTKTFIKIYDIKDIETWFHVFVKLSDNIYSIIHNNIHLNFKLDSKYNLKILNKNKINILNNTYSSCGYYCINSLYILIFGGKDAVSFFDDIYIYI